MCFSEPRMIVEKSLDALKKKSNSLSLKFTRTLRNRYNPFPGCPSMFLRKVSDSSTLERGTWKEDSIPRWFLEALLVFQIVIVKICFTFFVF